MSRQRMNITRACTHCGTEFRPFRGTQRVPTQGRFCSKTCFGLARRVPMVPLEVKRALKAEYDQQRRARLSDVIREKKRAAYYANHAENLRKLAEKRAQPGYREAVRAYQKQHFARPEWKKHKRQYDRKYRTERVFGEEFAEAASVLIDLEDEVARLCPDRMEIRIKNGTLNKTQRRKRNASSEAQRRRAQGHSVGHAVGSA